MARKIRFANAQRVKHRHSPVASMNLYDVIKTITRTNINEKPGELDTLTVTCYLTMEQIKHYDKHGLTVNYRLGVWSLEQCARPTEYARNCIMVFRSLPHAARYVNAAI